MTIITYLVVKLPGHLGVIMVFDRHIWRDYRFHSGHSSHRGEILFSTRSCGERQSHMGQKSQHKTDISLHNTYRMP